VDASVAVPKPKASSAVDGAKIPAAKGEKSKPKTETPLLTSTDGLSTAQRLLFIAAIVAACTLFIRSRGAKTDAVGVDRFKEKSLA
jgi:hypothetical protein